MTKTIRIPEKVLHEAASLAPHTWRTVQSFIEKYSREEALSGEGSAFAFQDPVSFDMVIEDPGPRLESVFTSLKKYGVYYALNTVQLIESMEEVNQRLGAQ